MTTKTLTLDPLYPDRTPAIGTALWVTVDRDVAIKGAGTIAKKNARKRYTVGRDGVFPTISVVPNDDATLQPWSQGYSLTIEAEPTPAGGITGGPWPVVITSAQASAIRMSDLEVAQPIPSEFATIGAFMGQLNSIQAAADAAAADAHSVIDALGGPGAVDDVMNAAANAAAAQSSATASASAAAASAALVGAPAGTAVDAHLGAGTDVTGALQIIPAGATGVASSGPLVKVGFTGNAIASDVGIAGIFGGGGTNWENVIGGSTANVGVNAHASNLPATPGINPPPSWTFIWGGYDNVCNGWACQINGYHTKVEAGANHCAMGGGSLHKIGADTAYAVIAGGTEHSHGANGAYNVIGGGWTNTINDGAGACTIAGGRSGTASGSGATLGGGYTNTSTGDKSTVAGGEQNQATTTNSTVSGGYQNKAITGTSNTVGGGYQNQALGNYSTVGGGLTNKATGVGATVPGGRDNTAAGDYSVASGRGAVASNAGENAYSSGPFVTPGDAQTATTVLKQTTTNATVTPLWNPNNGTPVIPASTTWAVDMLIVARRTDVVGENAAWLIRSCIKRDTGSTAALVGTPTITPFGANTGNTWSVAHTVDTTGPVRFTVTGETGKTIRWVGTLNVTQVQG